MSRDRKRATALNATDAKALIAQQLPMVSGVMTPAQIDQVQKVFDAAVVNPVVKQEAADLESKATRRVGTLVVQDKGIAAHAQRVINETIFVTEAEKRVRLDIKKLLAPNALKPTSDNPDEATYLLKVRRWLDDPGVWLRIGNKIVRDDGHTVVDPRQYEFWLSLGPDGDAIPTRDGNLTREALLKTVAIGAGYWESVDNGPARAVLKKQIAILEADIEDGEEEHQRLTRRYRDAAPGVAEISDWAGGADLPDFSLWDFPHAMVLKALQAIVDGHIMQARTFTIVAAVATSNAMKVLMQYADDSSRGAGRIVTGLKVLKTAGKVAEVVLAVVTVAGAARLMTTTGATELAGEGAARVGGGAARRAGVSAAEEVQEGEQTVEEILEKFYRENPEYRTPQPGRTLQIIPKNGGGGAGGYRPGSQTPGKGVGRHTLW